MEAFTLLNKQRDRIKIFMLYEDVCKSSQSINAMEIQNACVYKRSRKPVFKSSRFKSIEDVRKEYNQLLLRKLEEDQYIQKAIFKYLNLKLCVIYLIKVNISII